MSRINEALRRLSPGTSGSAYALTGPRDVATIDHYPRETGSPRHREPGVSSLVAVEGSLAPPVPPAGIETPSPSVTGDPLLSPAPPTAGVALDGELARRLVVSTAATPVMVEQYRRLAAAVHDAQLERGLRTLMVTSALPREGKTLTAVNLALTLSESYGRRVLLIDADLRKPAAHRVLGCENRQGLSEALSMDEGSPLLLDVSSRFSLLPAGNPGPSPLAGLTSERMRTLLEAFETEYDWVILDTPPVGFLPDAQLLARLTRAAILVIAAGSSEYSPVERAVDAIGRDCIIGTVLNRVDEQIPAQLQYHS